MGAKYNYDAYRDVYDAILEDGITESTKDYQAATEIFADYIGNVVAGNKPLLNNFVARNSNRKRCVLVIQQRGLNTLIK